MDIKRQFFPVAFMLISHETAEDYWHFFKSLKEICESLEIDLNPKIFALDVNLKL